MSRALVIVAAEDTLHREIAGHAVQALAGRHDVTVIDLVDSGFVPWMSRSEREAYHGPNPVLDGVVSSHVDLVLAASVLVFVFPTDWWSPPPILKGWLERVFVPGVAFTFDERGKVRPNLRRVQAIAAVTTSTPRRRRRGGGNGTRRLLLRSLRLNVPHRVGRVWLDLDRVTARSRFDRVARELARL